MKTTKTKMPSLKAVKQSTKKITPALKKFNEKMVNKKGNKTGAVDTSKWGA